MKIFTLMMILAAVGLSSDISFTWAADTVILLDGERLTLEVKNQPLSTILARLSEQGIRVHIDPRINPRVTATFHSRPIGPAMDSLLRSFDYALTWKKDEANPSDEPRLREIRIFYKGQESQSRPLRNGANLTVVAQDDGTYHVKDILLLRLAPNMTQSALTALLDQLNATIIDTNTPLGIVQLRLPGDSDVETIARTVDSHPGVEIAEPDFAYPSGGAQPIPMDQPLSSAAPANQSTEGTVVAVMDSGLQSSYENSPFVQGLYNAVSPSEGVDDNLGHGTQMALIAAGVVNPLGVPSGNGENSPVVVIRTIDDNGFTSNYTLIRGINYALQKNSRVLSLSWGSENVSPLLESTIHYAAAKGLILVAAAGNTPTGKPVYPAAYEDVIGVGALTPDGTPWERSNFGDFVTIQAPGLANLPVGYEGVPGTYAGTSIATAYTARRVAAILDKIPGADLNTILLNLSKEP